MKGGFKESPLKLNAGLGLLESWNENYVQARADRLADEALKVWAAPKLAPEILAGYRPQVESDGGYSINNHPYLLMNPIQALFEAFSKEVFIP